MPQMPICSRLGITILNRSTSLCDKKTKKKTKKNDNNRKLKRKKERRQKKFSLHCRAKGRAAQRGKTPSRGARRLDGTGYSTAVDYGSIISTVILCVRGLAPGTSVVICTSISAVPTSTAS